MKVVKLINLTPHSIHLMADEGKGIIIYPEPEPARLSASIAQRGTIQVEGHKGIDIPLTETVFGDPENLPDPVEGVLLIVSQMIKSALPDRSDLVVPAQVVRNSEGNIIGCRSLGV